MNSTTSTPHAPIATQSVFSRPAAMIGGAIGLVALTAVATTLALRPADPKGAGATPAPLMALNAPATQARATTPPEAPADFPEKMVPPAAPTPAQASGGKAPAAHAAPKSVHVQRGTVKTAPAEHVASVCATCGKVESVAEVKQKGEGTGLGVVGGAVVGGLLGHQVGGGSGKNVATVLGAVGGGVAGNEVEKRARSRTLYQVKVRMEDGSLRTVTQGSAPAVGQKVTVEGSALKARA